MIYPPEPIEIRRFKKIAAALGIGSAIFFMIFSCNRYTCFAGNRTTKQVCSRVQKYFLKLYKAGLPIPGRIPKTISKYKVKI